MCEFCELVPDDELPWFFNGKNYLEDYPEFKAGIISGVDWGRPCIAVTTFKPLRQYTIDINFCPVCGADLSN